MHFYCQHCNQRVPSDRKFSLVAGHSVGTLLSFVYPSRAQYSLSWHPGSSCSKQESRQVSGVKMLCVWNIWPFKLCCNAFGLKIFLSSWLGGTRCDIHDGWISRDPLEGERTSDRSFRDLNVKRWCGTPSFPCQFQCLDFSFVSKYCPKQSQVSKEKVSCFFNDVAPTWKKRCTWLVLCVFLCFPCVLLHLSFPLNGTVEADIITYLSKVEENHQCLAFQFTAIREVVASTWSQWQPRKKHPKVEARMPWWR